VSDGMKLKRIDPADVAQKFRERPGVEPIRGSFARRPTTTKGPMGCCGLTAYFDIQNEVVGGYSFEIQNRTEEAGLSRDYCNGFICGWDGANLPESKTRQAGHADGLAAWNLVQADRAAAKAAR
jgi:hypothetical protein